MLMSQGARSAGVIGCPNRGASAASATLRPSASPVAKASISRIDMAHLALVIDPPAGDGVTVLGTALQDRGATIPVPRNAEASEGFAQNRHLHRRLRQALAAVGRDLDLADAAISGKGNAGDLVEAGLALPSTVLGPVDSPPWKRQRRFPGTTLMMHGAPARGFGAAPRSEFAHHDIESAPGI